MKKLWTDLHSNIHHNQMDELDKWTEHAKEVLDFWPIAYYPFQMIKTESWSRARRFMSGRRD